MPPFLRAGAASIAKAYWLIADRVRSFGKVFHFHNCIELIDWLFPQQFAVCFLHGVEQTAIEQFGWDATLPT